MTALPRSVAAMVRMEPPPELRVHPAEQLQWNLLGR
jgi:hypothetical protein